MIKASELKIGQKFRIPGFGRCVHTVTREARESHCMMVVECSYVIKGSTHLMDLDIWFEVEIVGA